MLTEVKLPFFGHQFKNGGEIKFKNLETQF
jgi:hypothetical protein